MKLHYLTSIKKTIINFKNLILKRALFVLFIIIHLVSNAQLMFSEPFDEITESVNGLQLVPTVLMQMIFLK